MQSLNHLHRDPRRRDFLARVTQAVGGLALAGAAGPLLVNAPGWDNGAANSPLEQAFDYRAQGTGQRMGIGRGTDRASTLDMALTAIGGLGAFMGPADRVLIKVNAGFATDPGLGATTHPDLVRALVQRCLQAGVAQVMVTDHSVADPLGCFQISGIGSAARQAGAQVLIPGADAFSPLTLPGGQLIRNWPALTSPLRQATRFISVCPLKHHNLAGATMTLKNVYGVLGGQRGLFHQDIHQLIAELSQLVRPTLAVLDATWAMVRNGPTGGSTADLETRDTIAVSSDPVAVDAFGASLLGLQAADLPYLLSAAASGTGDINWRALLGAPPP